MQKKFAYLVRHYWPILFIVIAEAILFATNYKPGTFLIGWDNLYPELNSGLNIKRSFFAIWQEYRSLGYMDGMSHAANLFHDIFRWLLSLVMPLNLVRWAMIFLLHLTGGIGMYWLMQYYVFKKSHTENNHTTHHSHHPIYNTFTFQLLGLFAGLFYQYNLITIQQFFLPFELFLFHFAFLPWLIYLSLEYIDSGRKKYLIGFTLASFLSIPQAHVPTIFIVYVMTLGILMFVKFIQNHKIAFRRSFILIALTVTINAYWGIPFTYATLTNANVIANSKNNQMGTDDIFYRNLKFGELAEVIQFKGIVLDYWQYDIKSGNTHIMMHPWIKHINTLFFQIPAWLYFFLIIVGLLYSLWKGHKSLYPLSVLLIFAFVMMATDTPGVRLISEFMRDYIPLFHNVFRFTFTKFAFLYAFACTIFLTYGIYVFIRLIDHLKTRQLTLIFACLTIFMYAAPAFQNHFFYENLAVPMPQAYFNSFNFFKEQDHTERVAVLPIPWYWAWTQNNWNTIGSGFTWYGIPQPTTDRAFDPWSDKNENFYWELDQAIFSSNIARLEMVLDKYDIQWIFFDKSVYHGAAVKFDFNRYESLLQQSGRVKHTRTFDFIDIYSFDRKNKTNNFVSIKTDIPNIMPSYHNDNIDTAYTLRGDYINSSAQDRDIYFPFRSLFSGKKPAEQEFNIQETEETIAFTAQLDPSMKDQFLQIPPLFDEEFSINHAQNDIITTASYSARVYLDDLLLVESQDFHGGVQIQIPEFTDGILKVEIDKDATARYQSQTDNKLLNLTNNLCTAPPKTQADIEPVTQPENGLKFTSVGSNNCVNIDLFDLSQRYGYLFHLKTKNSPVKGLFMSVINVMTRKSDLETYLDHDGQEHEYYFVLPPRDIFGIGYSLNVNNVSFGREKIVNELQKVEVYQIPFYFLKELSIQPQMTRYRSPQNITEGLQVNHNNSFTYTVNLTAPNSNTPNEILYLSQGFDPGWKAYTIQKTGVMERFFPMFFGTELKEHVKVNNWANGWKINSEICKKQCTVVLVFWPQYLEWVGFGMLIITIIILVKKTYPKKLHNATRLPKHLHPRPSSFYPL